MYIEGIGRHIDDLSSGSESIDSIDTLMLVYRLNDIGISIVSIVSIGSVEVAMILGT